MTTNDSEPIKIQTIFSREDDGYIAFVDGKPSLSAWGETKEKALAEMQVVLGLVKEVEDSWPYVEELEAKVKNLQTEVAELREKLQLDQIGTHSENCWDFGRKHYGCALGKIAQLTTDCDNWKRFTIEARREVCVVADDLQKARAEIERLQKYEDAGKQLFSAARYYLDSFSEGAYEEIMSKVAQWEVLVGSMKPKQEETDANTN